MNKYEFKFKIVEIEAESLAEAQNVLKRQIRDELPNIIREIKEKRPSKAKRK